MDRPAKPTTSIYSEPPYELFEPPPPEQPRVFMEGPFSHPLMSAAQRGGWDVVVKYSRGPWRHATQDKYKLVHMITAVFIRPEVRVAAIWTAEVRDVTKYDFYTAIRNDQLGRLNNKELRVLLISGPEGSTSE